MAEAADREPERRPGMKRPALDIRIGDVVQLRKRHPCGSDRWQVYRVGADIGLRCLGCERRVMIPRSKLTRQVKAVWPPQTAAEGREEGKP